MSGNIELLIADLSRGAVMLEKYGVHPHWPARLRGYADRLERGDGSAAEDLLKQFGGMGSFNDVYIHPSNGHRLKQDEVDAVNDELNSLRRRLYRTAKGLSR